MKSIIRVLSISQLQTLSNLEIELTYKLKEKDKLIENLNVQFQNKMKGEKEKHESQVVEYGKIVNALRKTYARKENKLKEIYVKCSSASTKIKELE